MTPLEAMCRAVCELRCGDPDFDYGMNKPRWLDFVPDCRAALDALASNISEGMVEAGEDAINSDGSRCNDVFTAMLQRAKEEG